MNNLKATRTARGISIWQLASLAKSSPTTISAVERYDFQPTQPTKSKLAKALGVDVSEVWPDSDAPDQPVYIPQDA